MTKIALCDDDRQALPIIAGAVHSAFHAKSIQTELTRFYSGSVLLKRMAEAHYDIVLLDIDMPEIDGIEVGKQIRARFPQTKIVYVSECESRVFESFAVQPLGFVRKSNFFNDISGVVDLYIKTTEAEKDTSHVEFQTRTSLISLQLNQMRYIEGSRNYQLVHMADRKEPVEVRMTLEKLEELLLPHGFIRIHKGFLVNHRYIQRIDAAALTLLDGQELPIGRNRVSEVKAAYLSLLGDL